LVAFDVHQCRGLAPGGTWRDALAAERDTGASCTATLRLDRPATSRALNRA
jgi:hypothetical protein